MISRIFTSYAQRLKDNDTAEKMARIAKLSGLALVPGLGQIEFFTLNKKLALNLSPHHTFFPKPTTPTDKGLRIAARSAFGLGAAGGAFTGAFLFGGTLPIAGLSLIGLVAAPVALSMAGAIGFLSVYTPFYYLPRQILKAMHHVPEEEILPQSRKIRQKQLKRYQKSSSYRNRLAR